MSNLKVILFCHYCLLTSNVLDTSSTLSFTFDFTFTDGLMLDFVFLLTLGLSSAGSLLQSVNIMNVSLHVFWIKSCHNLLGKLLHFYQSTWYKLMILNFRRVWEVFLSFRYLASISHWLLRLPGICLSIFQCPFSCVMLGGKMAIYAYFREILVSEPTYSHTPHSAERALAWNRLSNVKKRRKKLLFNRTTMLWYMCCQYFELMTRVNVLRKNIFNTGKSGGGWDIGPGKASPLPNPKASTLKETFFPLPLPLPAIYKCIENSQT